MSKSACCRARSTARRCRATPTPSIRPVAISATGWPTRSPGSAAPGPSSSSSSSFSSCGRRATRCCSARAFDPYPFIFLNLILSMIAALQAPVIMMSQNRQAERDRIDAAHDYEVNLKAEIEIMALHEKLDELRHSQLIEMRDEIEGPFGAAHAHRTSGLRQAIAPDDRHDLHQLVARYGLIAVFLGCVAEGESAAILGGFFAHQKVFVPWQAFRGRLPRRLHRRHAVLPGRAALLRPSMGEAAARQAGLSPRLPAGAAASRHLFVLRQPLRLRHAPGRRHRGRLVRHHRCRGSCSSTACRRWSGPRCSRIGYVVRAGRRAASSARRLHEHQRLLLALAGLAVGSLAWSRAHYVASRQGRLTVIDVSRSPRSRISGMIRSSSSARCRVSMATSRAFSSA